MRAEIKVEMAGAAFDCPGDELARILRGVAAWNDGNDLRENPDLILRDINGNTVGTFRVTR